MSGISNFYTRYGLAAFFALTGVILFFINLFIHAADPMASAKWMQLFGLPTSFPDFFYVPWTLVTYPFVQPLGFIIAIIDIAMFYSFANIHRQFAGERKNKSLIFFSWLVPPVLVLIAGSLIPGNELPFLIGFTPVTLTIIGAAITLVPGYPVMLYGIVQIKILWLGLIFIAIEIANFGLWRSSQGLAAMICPVVGFVYIRLLQNGTDITSWMDFSFLRKSKKSKSKLRIVHSKPQLDSVEIDRILDKISAAGYEKLSKTEKETLANFSNQDEGGKPIGRDPGK